VRTTGRTSIFIEAPYRNNRMIADIVRSLSSHTLLCVASDVTGPKQNIRTMNVGRWAKAEYDYDRVPTIFLLGRGQLNVLDAPYAPTVASPAFSTTWRAQTLSAWPT